jgi:hypothetical protein
VTCNDQIIIDPLISTYPNINYDLDTRSINFNKYVLPGKYTFTFNITFGSVQKTKTMTFNVKKSPESIIIHNSNINFARDGTNDFIVGTENSGLDYDTSADVFYATSLPIRSSNDVN